MLRLLLRLNVTIPRHAGVDNRSFLPLPLVGVGVDIRIILNFADPLPFAPRKRCLFLSCINRLAIGPSIDRSTWRSTYRGTWRRGSATSQHEHTRHRYQKFQHFTLPDA